MELEKPNIAGTRNVLVADDEDSILKFVKEVLRKNGYEVLCARNGAEALNVGGKYAGIIDVLLTDIRMDRLEDGLELAERFTHVRPETAILITSGSNIPERYGAIPGSWGFLAKPFSMRELLFAVGWLAQSPLEPADWAAHV